jgi:hypothetical protein
MGGWIQCQYLVNYALTYITMTIDGNGLFAKKWLFIFIQY